MQAVSIDGIQNTASTKTVSTEVTSDTANNDNLSTKVVKSRQTPQPEK